jgi:hypothetical protein
MGYYATPTNGSRKLFLIPSLWNITHQSGPFNGGCSASSLLWTSIFCFFWGKRKITEGLMFFPSLKIPNYCCPPIILNFEENIYIY